MFFRKKCSNCGDKNPKDAITCARCGVPFELRQRASQKAVKNYEEVIRPKLKDADAYNTRGNRYAEIRQLERAIADYDEAIRLNPKFAVAYGNRAFAYKLQGNKAKAIAEFEKCITRTSDPRLIQMAKQQVEELSTK